MPGRATSLLIRRRAGAAAPTVPAPASPTGPGSAAALLLRRRFAVVTPPPPVPGTAADFWTAVLDLLNATASLSMDFPGGFFLPPVRPGQALPLATVQCPEPYPGFSPDDRLERPTFRVYAADDPAAGVYGDDLATAAALTLAGFLESSDARDPVSYTDARTGLSWEDAGATRVSWTGPRFAGRRGSARFYVVEFVLAFNCVRL